MSLTLANEKAESLERLSDLSKITHLKSWQSKILNPNLSESRAFTLTINSYVPEIIEDSDLCTLCNGKPPPLLIKILQGC